MGSFRIVNGPKGLEVVGSEDMAFSSVTESERSKIQDPVAALAALDVAEPFQLLGPPQDIVLPSQTVQEAAQALSVVQPPPTGSTFVCSHCAFTAASAAGLKAHQRARHA